MKKTIIVFLTVFSMVFFVSCGGDEKTETANDNNNETVDDETNDTSETIDDVQEQPDEIKDETENQIDENEPVDDVTELNDDEPVDENETSDEAEVTDDEEVTDENQENPYSCLGNPCAEDTECDCEADWCVIDDDNVSYAGLTKLTCAKKDCVVGDDSTCPADHTCTEIPSFVLTLMPELPKTVCKKK